MYVNKKGIYEIVLHDWRLSSATGEAKNLIGAQF
jgi:hypothetical protein